MIKAAILDFDGTLANTMPDLVTSINSMRAHFGYAPVTEKEVLRSVNYATPRYLQLSLPEDFDESRLPEATEAYFAYYQHHYLDKTKPYPGLPEVLLRLRREGVKLAVMSNKDNHHLREMTAALFPDLFDSVWGTVEDVPVKPNPARAFMIAEEFGLSPEEIAFIGDSDLDMKTAVNAGMIPVAASWGYREVKILRDAGAAYIADDANALYTILSSL